MRTAARRRRLDEFERKDFTRLQIKLQFKAVEVVAAEGGQQNAADLLVIASNFELFGGAADRQIIHENLRLIECAVRHAGELAELEISEVLHTNPDSNA